MKAKELRKLEASKLQERIKELNLEIFNGRFQRKMGTLENPQVMRNARREIARIKTILSENSSK